MTNKIDTIEKNELNNLVSNFKSVLKNGVYYIQKVEKTSVGYQYKVCAFNGVSERDFNVSFDFTPYGKGIVYIDYLGEVLICHSLKVNKCNFNGIPASWKKEYVREYIQRYRNSIAA